jgi:hypothetical protein
MEPKLSVTVFIADPSFLWIENGESFEPPPLADVG